MKGCNKFCTYCIVPYVKGRELYRPAQQIVDEVRMLVERHGIREVTLLGQTVTSYNLKNRKEGEPRFAELLLRIAEVQGLHRVRFMTGYPKDVHEDLLDAFRTQPKVQPYIHMPVQSGSDRILRLMNRGYTRATYLEKMAALRAARPGLSLTSDLIVGFPGETEEEFLETISLMEEVRYDSVFSFAYSERGASPQASPTRSRLKSAGGVWSTSTPSRTASRASCSRSASGVPKRSWCSGRAHATRRSFGAGRRSTAWSTLWVRPRSVTS